MKPILQFPLLALILLSACSVYDLTNLPISDVNEIYERSLEDAVYPTTRKVDNNLFPINKSNPDLAWKTINRD